MVMRMLKVRTEEFKYLFTDIYNFRDDNAKGRTINLACTLLAAFYNVFITGIFYTGFLTMYGIDITGAGIITFIPYIANMFSIFSSNILCKFKRRKPVLLAAKTFFYSMYIVATNLMPQFVHDNDARLMWFVIIQFIAHAVYAPFGPGITLWFYRFYPVENDRRTRFITLQQIFSSIMSSCILLMSSIITDAVSNSPYQHVLILGLRYLAYALVLIEIAVQAFAKEYPYDNETKVRYSQVFTEPFKYKKFLLCMAMMFSWNFIANLNNGLWNYHLLNHIHFSYTLINTMSIMYTFILLFTSGIWRKVLRKYSWIKTFGIATLLWFPTEFLFFFLTPNTTFLYVPLCTIQNLLSVGLNLSYSNILYMNLPEKNQTAHITFHTIGCNLFAFLGLITGTYVSSITGDNTFPMFGMEVYSVQFTTVMRGVTMLVLGLILFFRWKDFTNDRDIEEILS